MTRKERLEQDGAIDPILFYRPRGTHGCFSNFSPHPIILPSPWTLELITYDFSEVRFQAMKATTEEDHDYVAASNSPFESKQRGGPSGIKLRNDWGNSLGSICWYVMIEALTAKTLQHPDVRQTLSSSGSRWIYEDSPTDDIWGWRYRYSYNGKNLLGLAWMHVRTLLCLPALVACP